MAMDLTNNHRNTTNNHHHQHLHHTTSSTTTSNITTNIATTTNLTTATKINHTTSNNQHQQHHHQHLNIRDLEPTPPPIQRPISPGNISLVHWPTSGVERVRSWTTNTTNTSSSSPPSPVSSRASSKLSHEFDSWYQSLGIHSLYDFEAAASQAAASALDSNGAPKMTSLHDWVRQQPLSILALDAADRAVLKIAGEFQKVFCLLCVVEAFGFALLLRLFVQRWT